MKRHVMRFGAALAGVLTLAVMASSAQDPARPPVNRVPATRLESRDGKDLFTAYCAVCHGSTAKGDGPAAASLKTRPADLTTIAKRHGKFASRDIEFKITGQSESPVAAHGTRDMPMWGPVFRGLQSQPMATLSLSNLVKYLESIQEP